jgi:hypothetical protein
VLGPGKVQVERIGILHEKFATTHQAEPGPHLVAEFPLDVVKVKRQVLVRADVTAKDRSDHLLVGGPIQHVALMPIPDAQHLLAIGLVTAAFAPKVCRLDGRHEKFDCPGSVLLFAHDGAHFLQHPQSQRQEGVNPGRLLADHAGAQHQAVGSDLRVLRRFAQIGEEKAGKSHELSLR